MNPEPAYWRSDRSLSDVLRSELAFSLVYDNIRPDHLDEALQTVGLTRLPTHFLLIRVDDYLRSSRTYRITREFTFKAGILRTVEHCLAQEGAEGFAANLVGQDKLICFLCLTEPSAAAGKARLAAFSERIRRAVSDRSGNTVSVGISRRCRRLDAFAEEYGRLTAALDRSFFLGRAWSVDSAQLAETPAYAEEALSAGAAAPGEHELQQLYHPLCVAISRGDAAQIAAHCRGVVDTFTDLPDATPGAVRLAIVKLIHYLEDYTHRFGVPEEPLLRHVSDAIGIILSCGFLEDIRTPLEDVVQYMGAQAGRSGRGTDRLPAEPVLDYLEKNYPAGIRSADLAALFGYSTGHFERLFKERFGCSFKRYLNTYRLEQAADKLRTTADSVEETASRCGFETSAYFCLCFKKKYGLTPSEYREAVR